MQHVATNTIEHSNLHRAGAQNERIAHGITSHPSPPPPTHTYVAALVTKPWSRTTRLDMMDHAKGLPMHMWVAKQGKAMAHRFLKSGLAYADSGLRFRENHEDFSAGAAQTRHHTARVRVPNGGAAVPR